MSRLMTIALAAIVGALGALLTSRVIPAAEAQVQMGAACTIPRGWGTVKTWGQFTNARTTFLVLEGTDGTIRLVDFGGPARAGGYCGEIVRYPRS